MGLGCIEIHSKNNFAETQKTNETEKMVWTTATAAGATAVDTALKLQNNKKQLKNILK